MEYSLNLWSWFSKDSLILFKYWTPTPGWSIYSAVLQSLHYASPLLPVSQSWLEKGRIHSYSIYVFIHGFTCTRQSMFHLYIFNFFTYFSVICIFHMLRTQDRCFVLFLCLMFAILSFCLLTSKSTLPLPTPHFLLLLFVFFVLFCVFLINSK